MATAARECPACHTPLPDEAHFCLHCGTATPTEPGVPPRTTATGVVEVSRVTRALAGRYRVERVLGEGGMATVYLAEDLKHRRKVAVKVMRPELAATLGAERFLREVEIAARLSHPHILPMYDSGEADGLLYYVMPYVEGESLQARLRREGQLPVDEAVRLAREAAEALAYAHGRGIVHRDIKPANIMLSAGHALVADFGIARAVGGSGEALTRTGLAVGTPQYMSPEQAMGDRDVDARADVYAIGAVLYEMLAGEAPFTGPTPQAVVARCLTEPPRSLTATREHLPPGLDAVVARALAKSPADRPADATTLAAELGTVLEGARSGSTPVTAADGPSPALVWGLFGIASVAGMAVAVMLMRQRALPLWTLGLAAVLLAIGAGVLARTFRVEAIRRGGHAVRGLSRLFTWTNAALGGAMAFALWGVVATSVAVGRTGSPASGGAVRLAVLPFTNRGAAEDAYFVDGVADQVRGTLTSLGGFQVTARTSSDQYRESTKPLRDIGRELGVDYLLSATVSWVRAPGGEGGRVQVVPELIDVRTGAVAWQQAFDANLTDVFQVQADIATRVASALNVELGTGEREELTRRPTSNLAAWDAYLKGLASTGGSAQALRIRIDYFERAVALDSTFALAWAELANAYTALHFGYPSRTSAEAARTAVERVQALAPDAPETYRALGNYYNNVLFDQAGALAQYAEGLRRSPNDARLLTAEASASRSLGRWDHVVEVLGRARSLDPRSVQVTSQLASTYIWLRRYDEAEAEVARGLALAPDNTSLIQARAMIRLGRGDLAGAQAWIAEAMRGADPTLLVSHLAVSWDTYWLLDKSQQGLLLRLSPGAFGEDQAARALALAGVFMLQGDTRAARAYGDSAEAIFAGQLREVPDDNYLLALHGIALAYAGRMDEAVRAGERSVALLPIAKDGYSGPYNAHQLARVYVLAGQPDRAIDVLESLLAAPYFISPGWLRVDPTWDALRGNPRFDRLLR